MAHWDLHRAAAGLDPATRIAADSAALADAASGNLGRPVEHCPDWSVADLVWHTLAVQRFWREIVALRASDPHQIRDTERPDDASLVDAFREGTGQLVDVLRVADPATPVWTWALQKDAGFVIRHQVQEAAVHRWDAENAAGSPAPIDRAAAVDSIEEFLTFSTDVPDASPLGVALLLDATDADASWTVTDSRAGTLCWTRGGADAAVSLRGTASDLLLWLYGRAAFTPAGDSAVLDRFRGHVDTT
jgi:uncharacterized protein (TIGR03083 family)